MDATDLATAQTRLDYYKRQHNAYTSNITGKAIKAFHELIVGSGHYQLLEDYQSFLTKLGSQTIYDSKTVEKLFERADEVSKARSALNSGSDVKITADVECAEPSPRSNGHKELVA